MLVRMLSILIRTLWPIQRQPCMRNCVGGSKIKVCSIACCSNDMAHRRRVPSTGYCADSSYGSSIEDESRKVAYYHIRGGCADMYTTLDLSQYNDVTAYADAVHRPVVHVDYLPTPQAVARRVREAVDDRHLSMEQLAKDAHVSIQAAYSLRDSGLASLSEARRVFAVLDIHVHAYPVEMVSLSL